MKYLAVAGFAALAVASPAVDARDGWEQYDPAPTTTTSTWAEWSTSTTSTWAEWSTTTSSTTWAEWDPKHPKYTTTSTWAEWNSYEPKPSPKTTSIDWEEWEKHPAYTTTVVTAITTYCPEPTVIVHAGKTWTVTTATTLTITECPCTISVPVYTKTSTSCDYKSTPKADTSAYNTWESAKVPAASSSVAYNTWESAKVPAASSYASTWSAWTGTGTATGPAIPKWTGAANKVNVGAGVAGVVGLAALLL